MSKKTINELEQELAELKAQSAAREQVAAAAAAAAEAKLDSKLSAFKFQVWGVVAFAALILSLGGTLGIPKYFAFRMETEAEKTKTTFSGLEGHYQTLLTNFEEVVSNAARHPKIILAADYSERDPYILAILGKISQVGPDVSNPIYVELPQEDSDAAAARLQFLAKSFPSNSIIAALYNPHGQATEVFIARLTSGQIFMSYNNDFGDAFVQSQGGCLETHWLQRVPGIQNQQDTSLRGLALLAPAAATLAMRSTIDQNLNDFGPSFNYVKRRDYFPAAKGQFGGWVLFVDRHGNCLTSISTEDVRSLTGGGPGTFGLTCGTNQLQVKYAEHFSDVNDGELFAMNFDGTINLLKKNGSFSRELGVELATHVVAKK